MNYRFYRKWVNDNLETFSVTYKETDLLIRAPIKLPDLCLETVKELRTKLDNYIQNNPIFKKSFSPISINKFEPKIINKMNKAAHKVGVGPMAAVAGLFSEIVGQTILKKTGQVIVENGGDIFLYLKKNPVIGIYAGDKSPFTNKLGIEIKSNQTPLGICTSAGTVGPSYSKGKADAVIVLSPDTVLADAAATAIANKVQDKNDVGKVVEWGQQIHDIIGLVVIKDDKIGVWGKLKLKKI